MEDTHLDSPSFSTGNDESARKSKKRHHASASKTVKEEVSSLSCRCFVGIKVGVKVGVKVRVRVGVWVWV
jgi:hypothetical protein